MDRFKRRYAFAFRRLGVKSLVDGDQDLRIAQFERKRFCSDGILPKAWFVLHGFIIHELKKIYNCLRQKTLKIGHVLQKDVFSLD